MDKFSSPEERLLHLIRRKDAKQKAAPEKDLGKPQAAPSSTRPWHLKLPALKITSFKNLKTILAALAVFLVAYILLELVFSDVSEGKLTKAVLRNQSENKIGVILPASVKPYSYYASQFDQRDIFEASPAVGNVAKPTTVNTNFQQLTKNLKLVGVILDNNPQAIIENSAENKTYFLHKGELINDLKLEVITESKVILSYGSEKLELAL